MRRAGLTPAIKLHSFNEIVDSNPGRRDLLADQDDAEHGSGPIRKALVGEGGVAVMPGADMALYGSATLSPTGPVEVRSPQTFVLTYRVGRLGLDDTGSIGVCFRSVGDAGALQVCDPAAANYVSASCSGAARIVLQVTDGQRPWGKVLQARLHDGYLSEGDTITITFGDTAGGSPGWMMQTVAERAFEFRVLADVVATGHPVPLDDRLWIEVIAGPAVSWKAILPTLRRPGETFHLGLKAEDRWGNPTAAARGTLHLEANMQVEGLPRSVTFDGTARARAAEGLSVAAEGVLTIAVFEGERQVATAGPLVIRAGDIASFWGDLHGQTGETVGLSNAPDYFDFARNLAFLDVTSHQANDFQVNAAFWQHLNRLTATYDEPGRFVAIPGYEWSGNTAVGGDHNVFFRSEGRPIRRSSHALLADRGDAASDALDLKALYAALRDEDCVIYAHVGGRYANIAYAHDRRLETALELHSAWGSFEWLLTDAFRLGYRCGVVCNSDGHKGRPGASYPGASIFGAYGGLTCFLAGRLDRDAIFEAMRRRHHYGTTGSRMHIGLTLDLEAPGLVYERDPAAVADARCQPSGTAMMGDIVRTEADRATVEIEIRAPSPILEVAVFNGQTLVETHRPYDGDDLGERFRITWEGAEYRGRGRDTRWRGRARFQGRRILRLQKFNIWNHERLFELIGSDTVLWDAVSTGNIGGFDVWLGEGRDGVVQIATNRGRLDVPIPDIADRELALEAGGLNRRLSIRRLPEAGIPTETKHRCRVDLRPEGDNPVWARVTTEDGHRAWTSPIYLIR